MSELPYIKLWIGDYLAGTPTLNMEQSGSLLHLLFAMWENGGWLPNDPRKLAAICRMSLRRWRDHVAPELDQFFIKVEMESGDVIQNKRLTKELQKAREMRSQNSASARARWLKNNKPRDANGSSPHMQSESESEKSKGLHKRTLNREKGKR